MEPSFETLSQLRTAKFGVMSPTGEVTACSMYGHVNVLAELLGDEELKNLEAKLAAEVEEDIQNALDEHHQWMDENPDEHPEWHHFEIYEDGARSSVKRNFAATIVNEAYSRGWTRIGIFGDKIEFEGLEYFKNDIRYFGGTVADMLNLEYVENFVFRTVDSHDDNLYFTKSRQYSKNNKKR